MIYRTYAPTGEKVSLLGFGAMRFPTNEDGTINRAESEKMLDLAFQNGVNYFDTAYMYHNGESQSFLGEALKKYDRKSFYITNKFPVWMADTKADVARIFEDQLSKCQVDYFDYYLVHAIDASRFDKLKELEVYEYLKEQQKAGRIHQLGFSFHDTPEVLEDACKTWKWDFAQLQLNYLDWDFQHAKEQYEILCKYNLPCIVMEPVRGGALANLPEDVCAVFKKADPTRSIASWAMRYCASLPNVLTVLSGMTVYDQVEDNLATMNDFAPLTEAEHAVIQEALEVYRKNNLLPCTECKYCIDCPVSVNIPEIFKIYNTYRINGNGEDLMRDMKESVGCTPEACISCGACSSKCPQHIDIPEELSRIATLMDSLK